jgi:hypothetical protein
MIDRRHPSGPDSGINSFDGVVVESGKFMSVNRKKDGKWRYVRDTWNSDAPPAPAE